MTKQERRRNEIKNGNSPWQRVFMFSAIVGMFGWLGFFALTMFWLFQPIEVPTIDEPIPILNEDQTVRVGEAILMDLAVDKPVGYQIIEVNRFIECDSGKVVPLTDGEARTLPVGSYTIRVDNIILPTPVFDGDSCTFLFKNVYDINPFKTIQTEFRSEPFTVYN